jgi:hypothetical protein
MTTMTPAKPEDAEQDAGTAFEGEIREFVRRDLAPWRRPRTDPLTDVPVENVNSLINRVAGQTVSEIERVITELQNVRDILRKEGDRVQREIVGYANLSQAAMASMKIIAESMEQWKTGVTPEQSESA